MPFTIIDVEQRSPEWHLARAGRLTSSRSEAMLAQGKGDKEAVSRRNLRVQMALERITGRSLDRDFMTQAMRDGVEREVDAAGLYEAVTGNILTRTGFCQHDSLMAGCSLDGHVSGLVNNCVDDFAGIVEIKSPIHATHLEYLRTGIVPNDYLKQITHSLWVTGASWCDWMSYQPDFPERLQSKLVRVNRADVDIAGYESKALAFLREVDAEAKDIAAL